jgi:hypothetical protein
MYSTFVMTTATGIMCGISLGAPPAGDIFLSIEGGRIVTGRIGEDGTGFVPNVRVFAAELGVDIPNATDEPGMQSLPGTFDPAGHVGFNFLRALRRWNGADFSVIPLETMSASWGPLSATTPAVDGPMPGFNMPVEPEGTFHEHPFWTLNAPAEAGVYLVTLELVASNAAPSDPLWLLFSLDASEAEFDVAYEWAAANVPAPGTFTLLLPCCAARRRR